MMQFKGSFEKNKDFKESVEKKKQDFPPFNVEDFKNNISGDLEVSDESDADEIVLVCKKDLMSLRVAYAQLGRDPEEHDFKNFPIRMEFAEFNDKKNKRTTAYFKSMSELLHFLSDFRAKNNLRQKNPIS